MAKTKKNLIPKSKARTAYGLLSSIIALVRDEPRRMRMMSWGTPMDYLHAGQRPACGTVGCIGGWTEILRPGAPAGVTLGLDRDQEHDLFFGDLCGDAQQGTKRHAKRVIRMIEHFQQQYAAQLKAKRV